jgi:hypothetical protein
MLKIDYFLGDENYICVKGWRNGDTYIWNMLVQNSAVSGIGDPLSVGIVWFKYIWKQQKKNEEMQYTILI